jgi:hypothetical protein
MESQISQLNNHIWWIIVVEKDDLVDEEFIGSTV